MKSGLVKKNSKYEAMLYNNNATNFFNYLVIILTCNILVEFSTLDEISNEIVNR